jgi:predicted O-methyltransferase YrrM
VPSSAVLDPQVHAVLDRIRADDRRALERHPRGPGGADPHDYVEIGFSIEPGQGELIYLLCRAIGATRVVDFATSVGISAIYFAAAVRDNGGGRVIGSELVPAKAEIARRNIADAGLAEFVDVRVGDARETLLDVGGPVDFALIDGWGRTVIPSLALDVLTLIEPQLRIGALVLNDNGEADYLQYVRDPANKFRSVSLPIKGETELSIKVGAEAT